MRSRRTVEQWRQAVFLAAVSDSVKVYLLKLADHMDSERMVRVARSQLARELKRHEQRIAERSTAAVAAGLLDVVSPGRKGHTAVYQGLFPDVVRDSKRTDLQYAKNLPDRYAIEPLSVPDGEYTSSYTQPSGRAVGDVPNEKRQRSEGDGQPGAQVRAMVDGLHDQRDQGDARRGRSA